MGSCVSVVRKKDMVSKDIANTKKKHNNGETKMSDYTTNQLYNMTPRYSTPR